MSARRWLASITAAGGTAAGVAAAQLGVGYGLGIVAWPSQAGGEGENAWVTSLAWATWIAATSVAVGAVCAARLDAAQAAAGHRTGTVRAKVTTSLRRGVLALSAAIGALVTVPLVTVPARVVDHPATSAPEAIAGGYALVGVILGLVVAPGVLAARAVTANMIASLGWFWLLAVATVIDGVTAGRDGVTTQLAVWQFTSSGPDVPNINVWQALFTLGSALLIGVLAALPAARRGDSALGVAVSGAIGPLLVAAVYLLVAPTLTEVSSGEISAYLVAPYAVLTGLAGSVAVAGLGPRLMGRPADREPTGAPQAEEPRADEPRADEPTEAAPEPTGSATERPDRQAPPAPVGT
ncbi:MAG: hypothetical protein FWJ93_05145 [Micromonosporaceae bacterium]